MARSVRYIYEGGGALTRYGRVVTLEEEQEGEERQTVQAALQLDGVDFSRWRALIFDKEVQGWTAMDDAFLGTATLTDVMLVDDFSLRGKRRAEADAQTLKPGQAPTRLPSHEDKQDDDLGYFGVGIVGAKTESNVGTLWRSAWQLGAAFIFTVGARFQKSSADTNKTFMHLPTIEDPGA